MSELLALAPTPSPANQPVLLDLAADHYKRYPSERVHFFLRVRQRDALAGELDGATLLLCLPGGLEWQEAADETSEDESPRAAFIEDLHGGTTAHWRLDHSASSGAPASLDFKAAAVAKVKLLERDLGSDETIDVPVQAVLRGKKGTTLASTWVHIHVEAQSRLMRYLPEIYQDYQDYPENELLGRFLMCFESFWNPIVGQINSGEVYYDPRLTPAEFLPWLASWLGEAWNEQSLPVDRQRSLLISALDLYQRRGTRQGLEQLLRLYTGGKVKIVEHRAENLVLGPSSYLGYTHALGLDNAPNTFSVTIHLTYQQLSAFFDQEQDCREDLLHQRLEALIETQKPAHTVFRLQLVITGASPREDHSTS